MSAINQPAGAGTPQPKQQSQQTIPQSGQKTQLPAKDDDPKSLKQNLVVAFKDVIEYVKTADTANPSVLDLVQSCIDGLDAVFSSLTHRFEQLPESPESDEEPNYKAEDIQGSDIPTVKSVDLGTAIFAKAFSIPLPDGVGIMVNPSTSERWDTLTKNFSEDLLAMQSSLADRQKPRFFLKTGVCLGTLDEMLAMVYPIMSDTEVETWKRVMVELRSNMKSAMESIDIDSVCAVAFLRKVSKCYDEIQKRVPFIEDRINKMTNRISSFFNRS